MQSAMKRREKMPHLLSSRRRPGTRNSPANAGGKSLRHWRIRIYIAPCLRRGRLGPRVREDDKSWLHFILYVPSIYNNKKYPNSAEHKK